MRLSDLLFGPARETAAQVLARFPARPLPPGAMVTRFAPSPTGFMHIGGLYAALISCLLARRSDGVFFLRIEDTDKVREIDGAVELIVQSLAEFGVVPSEGEVEPGREVGAYGPYRQSARADLYRAFARQLLDSGHAYPCFATPEELDALVAAQRERNQTTGYYGDAAIWRDRPVDDVRQALADGRRFVIRLRSGGTPGGGTVTCPDLIRGDLALPANFLDAVVLKSDGLPTYHFAHVVDDTLMHTTHVVRGDEWISSLPLHLELFDVLGWTTPRYAHIAPIQTLDGESRRKLSKRKDPEANIRFYLDRGYPRGAVIEYLLNLADSSFEGWRAANPPADAMTYPLDLSSLNVSGALLDLAKLDSVSRDYVARQPVDVLIGEASAWAARHAPLLHACLVASADYARAVFELPRRDPARIRKDVAVWADVERALGFLFDPLYERDFAEEVVAHVREMPAPLRAAIADVGRLDSIADKAAWQAHVQAAAARHGFARNKKELQGAPERFHGMISDLYHALRRVVTGTLESPDLWDVIETLTPPRVQRRIASVLERAGG